jgi:hypothetical protein
MNPTNSENQEFDRLVSAYCDHCIAPEEFSTLEVELRSNAALRERFVRLRLLHGGLAWDCAREANVQVTATPAAAERPRSLSDNRVEPIFGDMAVPPVSRRRQAIVGVLIGTVAAVVVGGMWISFFRAKDRSEDLDCKNDIILLHQAITAFCMDPRLGAIGFMPSRFDPSGGDPASRSYINRVFPHAGGSLGLPAVQLEGDQCLVLFLQGPKGDGWSADPRNPGTTRGGDRIGPFFDFKPERVVDVHGNGYPSYIDRWKTMPYAYFSATSRAEDHWVPNSYGDDCPFLKVQPYAGRNLNSFQIIGAGRNKRFGLEGAQWTPANAHQIYPRGSDGADDVANFFDTPLGGK